MADRSALLPTSEHGGYGAAPTSSRRERAPNNGFKNRVLAAVAGACGVVGVVALRANGGGLLPAVGEASQARGGIVALSELVARHGELRTVLAQQHAPSRTPSPRRVNMKVRPIANVGRAPSAPPRRVGDFPAEHCVAKGSAPSESYNVTDENPHPRRPHLRRVARGFPRRHRVQRLEGSPHERRVRDSSSRHVPGDPAVHGSRDGVVLRQVVLHAHAQELRPGRQELRVVRALRPRAVRRDRGLPHECATLREHVAAKEKQYDSMEVGGLPCRTAPDAPFAKAAYAQVKYEEAYTNWVDSVNDATEVCTIGHALWVHNLGLYQAHYEKIRETMNDLIQLCENFSQTATWT